MKEITSENVHEHIFEDNLKEFSAKLSFIISLEQGGKKTPEEAYNEIKQLYKKLKATKKNLLKKED